MPPSIQLDARGRTGTDETNPFVQRVEQKQSEIEFLRYLQRTLKRELGRIDKRIEELLQQT